MRKEHSGGTPEIGHISISSWTDENFTVPIEHFDFSSLDKPEDHIVEAVHQGQDIGPIVRAIVEKASASRCAVRLSGLLSIILEAHNPRMIAHQIIWATGLTLTDGAPITELAKLYGISKQAFEQGALRVCEKLHLRPCRTMRSEEGRETMSKRNYRK